MFKKEDYQKEVETIIGPSVKVEGDFSGQGNIIVDGIVTGNLKTEKNLKVGGGAKILANITAENALIAGEVQGNLKIGGQLELTETAKIFGDIKTKILSVTPGALINGKCLMGGHKEKAQTDELNQKKEKEISKKEPDKK